MVVHLEPGASVCVRPLSEEEEGVHLGGELTVESTLVSNLYQCPGERSSQNSVLGCILMALVNRPSNLAHTLFLLH